MFENKTLLVTGGTGSFGQTLIKKMIDKHNFGRIIVFSRDETKQHDMRIQLKNPAISFHIGDVRDLASVTPAMLGVDYVFHAAALKHVPSCEFFPLEAVKTNILGAQNVLDAAGQAGVQKVVVLSTDKAVYPINAMGISKAMMEKITQAKARSHLETVYCTVRYGNVMYSRGSVIPLFVSQIKNNKPLTVTNPGMTRFLLSLDHAVDLVLFALTEGASGDLFVRKAPGATTGEIAQALVNLFQVDNPIEVIGVREGEKLHESLMGWEESTAAQDLTEYYRIPQDKTHDYDKYLNKGETRGEQSGYTSENTARIDIASIEQLLMTLPEIQQELKAFNR